MRRVIRVGGSLLTWNKYPLALRNWLSGEAQATNLLIVGGGPWVELLRAAAQRFVLRESAAHAICIQAMSVTAALLAETMSFPLARAFDDLGSEPTVVLDVGEFMRVEEPHYPGTRLPSTWEVTSDSIAVRLAQVWQADDVVLLKSKAPPGVAGGHAALAEQGYVDRFFPRIASGMNVRFVNLRDQQDVSPGNHLSDTSPSLRGL